MRGAAVRVLLFNAGSSSLKATLVEAGGGRVLAHASADWAGPVTRYSCTGPTGARVSEEVPWRGHAEAVERVLGDIAAAPDRSGAPAPPLVAVGHRVVHGGAFRASVRIAPEVRSRIAALAELAPLHNPPGLETLAAAEAELPDVPHVAVFDTAFHHTLPPHAYHYALPYEDC